LLRCTLDPLGFGAAVAVVPDWLLVKFGAQFAEGTVRRMLQQVKNVKFLSLISEGWYLTTQNHAILPALLTFVIQPVVFDFALATQVEMVVFH
jgi:hypothetical protein